MAVSDSANSKSTSRQTEIEPSDVKGMKYFRQLKPLLKPLLKRLHRVGTERDRANNRNLHMDEYCTLTLKCCEEFPAG